MPQENDQALMKNPHLEEIVANENGVLRCRGLPYGSAEQEIFDFFKDFKVVQDGVKLVMQKDGRPSGQAFVLFETQAEAKRALSMDNERISNRYIELFVSNVKEMMNSLTKASVSSSHFNR